MKPKAKSKSPRKPRSRPARTVPLCGLLLSRRAAAQVARYADEHGLLPRTAVAEILEQWSDSHPGEPT